MKPRDLLPIIERVRRATTNGDVLTICDALFKRVQHEIVTTTVRKTVPGGIPPKLSGNRADMVIVDDPHAPDEYLAGITNRDMPRTAMDAVVERAEGGRKPATGKAKRAIAKAAARKAARKAAKS